VIRVGQLRADRQGRTATVCEKTTRGVFCVQAQGARVWGSAALIEEDWPTVLAEPESTPADEGPAQWREARESEATS
jgi:hypothetical protein